MRSHIVLSKLAPLCTSSCLSIDGRSGFYVIITVSPSLYQQFSNSLGTLSEPSTTLVSPCFMVTCASSVTLVAKMFHA
jgi:hypothetical protein